MQRKRGAGNIPAPQVNPRQLSLDKTDRVVIDYKKSGLYRPAFGKFHKHRMSGPEGECKSSQAKGPGHDDTLKSTVDPCAKGATWRQYAAGESLR